MRKIIYVYPYGRFKVKKTITFLLLIIYSILLFSGCNEADNTQSDGAFYDSAQTSKKTSETISLLYSSKDSLDPYTCVTEQNADLSQLIFDPLLIIDNQYEIEYRLAKNVEVSNNVCTIKLINAKFSDGSSVTADDVVFSFNKAKNSKTTRHSAALKYASYATANDTTTVVISLKRNDPYFANLLTFPIMKKGSDQLKDTDNQSLVPIGAGRYVFDNQTATLTLNPNYYGAVSVIKTIETVDCPDTESVTQAINSGMVDHYFSDLSGNTIPKMNGTSLSIAQNRIVFLGINSKNPQLSNSLFRQAISSAIDRQEICKSAYYGYASPALGPVPTIWSQAEGMLSIQSSSNAEISKNNIELAGYTKKDKDGFYLLKNDSPITFTLLVNANNNSRSLAADMISKTLANVGIKIKIKSVNETQYYAMLRSGSYDLFLGEIRYEDNMDLSGIISIESASKLLPNSTSSEENISTSSKISSKPTISVSSDVSDNLSNSSAEEIVVPGEITLTTIDAYNGFYNGNYSLQDLITAFNAELPVIPICFKNGMVIYSDKFGSGITPSKTELFHGIQYLK